MRWGVRTAAGLAALVWAVPFFGLIDLWVLADPGEFRAVVAVEASWGGLVTFVVAGALAAVAWSPRAARPAAVQIGMAAVAVLVGALLGADARPVPLAVALALISLALLKVDGRPLRAAFRWAPRWVFVAVAAAAAPFWSLHALAAFRASRELPPGTGDITWGIEHWPVHGAADLTIAVLAIVASVWPEGRRLLGVSACLAGTVLGAASLAYPASSGAMPGGPWSFATILWSLTVGLFAAAERAPAVEPVAAAPRTAAEAV